MKNEVKKWYAVTGCINRIWKGEAVHGKQGNKSWDLRSHMLPMILQVEENIKEKECNIVCLNKIELNKGLDLPWKTDRESKKGK